MPADPAERRGLQAAVPQMRVALALDRLKLGTTNVWMANPLSAVPTRFRVVTNDGRSWWGNCVWDALGILAMVGSDGAVDTSCPDCGEKIELRVKDGELQPVDAVIHFAVPAARWWENIAFT